MNDNKTMIEIKDLHKRYGDIEVLHGINLTVAPKEVVVVIGPSGSGKSTIFALYQLPGGSFLGRNLGGWRED